MYRGLPTQALRDIPASIAYFLIYEFLIYHGVKNFPNISSTLQSFVFGGVAGVVSWALIMPFDVMKSRIQADSDRKLYSGFWDCVVKSYRSNGIKIKNNDQLKGFPCKWHDLNDTYGTSEVIWREKTPAVIQRLIVDEFLFLYNITIWNPLLTTLSLPNSRSVISII